MSDQAKILTRIEEDHNRQRELLDKIAETSGDSDERRKLFEELNAELKSHAAAEEQSLYAEMIAEPDANDETRHSVAEHHEIDEMLNDLAATDMSSPGWLLKFKEFDHRYRHHINEEEEDHFPDFEELIDEKTDAKLTETFEERKEVEKQQAEITPVAADDAKE